MRAFVLRMAPGGVDWVPTALDANQISIGWGLAADLMDPQLDKWQFREVAKRHYYPDVPTYQKAGSVAGILWLFLRETSIGNLVVVRTTGDQDLGMPS